MVIAYVAGQSRGPVAGLDGLLKDYAAAGVEVELRDETGVSLGRLLPPEPLCPWEPDLDHAEIDRRIAAGGMPLAQFWAERGVECPTT